MQHLSDVPYVRNARQTGPDSTCDDSTRVGMDGANSVAADLPSQSAAGGQRRRYADHDHRRAQLAAVTQRAQLDDLAWDSRSLEGIDEIPAKWNDHDGFPRARAVAGHEIE